MNRGTGVTLRRTLRQSSAAASLLRANFTRLSTPLKVNLCVTYRCNYRCRTCNIWKKKPTGELTTAELLEFAAQNRDVAWLDVTGGEIFLRADIEEFFDAVAREWTRLAILHFPTNGFLTDRVVSVVSRLVKQTPAQVIVTVSVDGDEESNDRIRGIRGGYKRQLETFNALRAVSGVRAVIGMTLSGENVGQFDRTFLALQRSSPGLTVEDVHVNVAQRAGHYYDNMDSAAVSAPKAALVAELRGYRDRRRMAWSPTAWAEQRYLTHLEQFASTNVMPMRCHALRSSCFIDPWGQVYPCISYDRPLGSLRDTNMALAPIWGQRLTQDVQGEIWKGKCPQCWTACEAYQSILGNLVRPFDRVESRRLPMA
jgi:radical SAM protein with 4Fe4S-binding SPASM domain